MSIVFLKIFQKLFTFHRQFCLPLRLKSPQDTTFILRASLRFSLMTHVQLLLRGPLHPSVLSDPLRRLRL